MIKNAKYLVRPSDFMIFSLNDDGETYDIDDFKKEYPDHLRMNYKLDLLLSCGFYSIEDNEFDIYMKKHDDYWKIEAHRWISDGHGGVKENINLQ